jgi:hypothetical protein
MLPVRRNAVSGLLLTEIDPFFDAPGVTFPKDTGF